MVGDTDATLIPPIIPCGLTRRMHSSEEMNSRESNAALIDDKNSSSTTGCYCMEKKSQLDLESEYCYRLECNRSISLTVNYIELGSQVQPDDVLLNQGRESTYA